MKRLGRLTVVAALLVSIALVSGCQRTIEVQTGTRVVDSQGRVISENIHTVRVPAETAGAYRINTIVQADTANAQLESLYAEAQSAIAAGDLKTAAQKLAQVIAISPTYRSAKKQSDAIKKGTKVTPDTTPSVPSTSTSTPTSTPPPKEPTDSSALLKWMPDVITGFTAEKAAIDPLAVSREYAPASGSPSKRLVIVAEQFRNSADAKRALSATVKQRYPEDSGTSVIHGHNVYFGTDGRQFAVIGFTEGPVMVALEASPDSGNPLAMKSLLEAVLGQLP